MSRRKCWEAYLDNLTRWQQHIILYKAIEHLLKIDEIGFQMDDLVDRHGNLIPEEASIEEFLYWKGSGENLLDEQ